MRASRSPALLVSMVLAATVSPVASAPATAATCVPKAPQACNVADFMRQAKASRANSDYRAFYAEDHVVARYKTRGAARSGASRHGARILRSVDGGGTVVLSVPKGRKASAFAKSLRADPGILYAERDARARTFGQVTDWGVADVQAPAAHTNGLTGTGVTVAVVDTGVDYNHEDLSGNIWTNAGETASNGIDDDGNGYVDDVRGYDFAGNLYTATQPDNDPMDGLGHGTHVAGIVAAEDNSVGVVGVAPDAQIMAVKVLDSVGYGWDSAIAQGIRYAVDNGADIINMSLGGYGVSGALSDAVAYAVANDVAVVAAAGNFWFYSLPSFPAAYPSVISVSAAREADHGKTWWSDWGHADFLAPGDAILSTTPDNTYDRFSGTSMASPNVAGSLALVKQANPGFDPDQLEQALASTAIDAYFAGRDEVSGAGFPNLDAATGALPDPQVQLYRSTYLIPADGTTASTVTLRILDASGAGVSGVTGTFATDKGTLSDTAFVTDADGEADTELTANDEWGSATVTATPLATPTASVRVIVEDDRVRVDDITVAPPGSGDDFFEESTVDGPKEPPPPPTPVLQPGDSVVVSGHLGRHNFSFADARASFSFSVTDPNDDPVPDLAGTLEPISIYGFGSQGVAQSMPLTIPADAVAGTYSVTGTATTIKPEGDEEHTFSVPFTVGVDEAEILLVRSGFSFDAETFNYLNPHQVDPVIRRKLEETGRSIIYWNMDRLGQPSANELMAHSTVVWLGSWDADLPIDSITTYLKAGGNLLLSGELYGTYARQASSADHRDFLHSIGLLTTFFPDDNNQIYPASVSGTTGGMFDGETFDLNSYNLNHRGESTAIFDEEHVLNTADGATSLFEYPSGYYGPAIAGVSVDTGLYRVVNLGFGIEAIEDPTQQGDMLSEILTNFAPPPSIDGVSPSTVTNSGLDAFEIAGDGFQSTGITHVFLGAREITDSVVLSRSAILAVVPSGFPVGTYTVKVVNPNGDVVTKSSAVKVVYPAPTIRTITPTYASNDRARTFVINGRYFRSGAKVRLAGKLLSSSRLSSTRLRATIPAGFTPLGLQDVRATNTDGKSALKRRGVLVRYGFTFTMGLGARNAAVPHLQRRLKAYGYFPSSQTITTFFGSITRASLIKYQKARKLSATGVLDSATRRKLNSEAGRETS